MCVSVCVFDSVHTVSVCLTVCARLHCVFECIVQLSGKGGGVGDRIVEGNVLGDPTIIEFQGSLGPQVNVR